MIASSLTDDSKSTTSQPLAAWQWGTQQLRPPQLNTLLRKYIQIRSEGKASRSRSTNSESVGRSFDTAFGFLRLPFCISYIRWQRSESPEAVLISSPARMNP